MTSAAQIANREVISYKRSTRSLRTVSISVSSLIDAILTMEEVKLSGRLWESSKLMLNTLALNSDAISATEKNSNI